MKLSSLIESIQGFMEKLTPRQLIVLATATACLVFLVVYITLSSFVPTETAPPAQKMASIVVAKSDIPARAVLQSGMLEIKNVPADAVPEGASGSVDDFIGHPSRMTILAGDVLTEKKIYMDIGHAGFSGVIPDNCRAVSIPVNDITGVDGFAQPGEYVDLMLIADGLDGNSVTGDIFMQNCLLLAVNKTVDDGGAKADAAKNGDNGDASATPVSSAASLGSPVTATLALTPEDALRLKVVAKTGEICMMVRPFRPSKSYVEDAEYTVPLPSSQPEPRQEPQPAPSAATPAFRPPAIPSRSSTPAPAAQPSKTSRPSASAMSPPNATANIEVFRGTTKSKGQ